MLDVFIVSQAIGNIVDTDFQLEVIIANEGNSRCRKACGLFKTILPGGRRQFVIGIAYFSRKGFDYGWRRNPRLLGDINESPLKEFAAVAQDEKGVFATSLHCGCDANLFGHCLCSIVKDACRKNSGISHRH